MNNILVKTTFKDHLILLKPFHHFYTKYWNPRTFIYYIGYTDNDVMNIKKKIENTFGIHLIFINEYPTNFSHCGKLQIYQISNMIFCLYKTVKNMKARIFNNELRPFLYNIPNQLFKLDNNYDFYLNTDNDDFFYVKDIDQYLKNYNKTEKYEHFHALEYIPNQVFDHRNDFMFISNSYFFRLKGAYNKELNNKTSHIWCRKLPLKNRSQNESHVNRKSHNCEVFDRNQNKSFESIDMICFCFSCLDLNYLINTKYWSQWSSNVHEKYKHSTNDIVDAFNKHYTLTSTEVQNNCIMKVNMFQEIFDDNTVFYRNRTCQLPPLSQKIPTYIIPLCLDKKISFIIKILKSNCGTTKIRQFLYHILTLNPFILFYDFFWNNFIHFFL